MFMKSTVLATMALMGFLQGAHAADSASAPGARASEVEQAEVVDGEVEVAPPKDEAEKRKLASHLSDFCFFSGRPPSDQKYTIVKKLRVGKGTYGGVKDVLPSLAERARKNGADAIMNYAGSQRFGFWPWRFVRPVVRGVAIQWTGASKPDCAAIGGTTLKDIIESDTPPAQ